MAETYSRAFLSCLAASAMFQAYLKSDLLLVPWYSPSGLPTVFLFSNDAVWGTILAFPDIHYLLILSPIYKFNNHSLTCLFSHMRFSDRSLDTCVLASLRINFQKFFFFSEVLFLFIFKSNYTFMQSFYLVW